MSANLARKMARNPAYVRSVMKNNMALRQKNRMLHGTAPMTIFIGLALSFVAGCLVGRLFHF